MLNVAGATPRANLIDQIVNESIQSNSAPLENSIDLGKPKRGVGRPKKGNKPNRRTLDLISSEFEGGKGSEKTDAPKSETEGTDSAALASELPEEMLAFALKFPSTLAREWTGYAGFTLDDQSARDAVPLARKSIEVLLPSLESSKYFPVYALALAIGGPLAMQAIEYKKYLKAKTVAASVESPPAPAFQ